MKRNGFLLTLVGTFGSIILTIIYALALTGIAKLIFSWRRNGESVLALMPNTTTYIIVAFFVFEIVFFVWLFSTMAKEKEDKFDGKLLNDKKAGKKLTKSTKIAGLAGIVVLIAMIACNAGIYTEVSKNSIKKKVFFSTQEYTWDDVYRYTLACDDEKVLTYSVQMQDGTTFELFQKSNSCSEEFETEFEDILSYAVYLSNILDTRDNILKDVDDPDIEAFYKEHGDWQKIKQIIE
ncbi:MAG: potassium-transporting ATPase subunit C [Ruminococcaceae bacterium]|nr:potassium-transporting ATPase subunit C [Oscillospiraceae bacterium]